MPICKLIPDIWAFLPALDYWKYSKANTSIHADLHPADNPYPVVPLSHGMGSAEFCIPRRLNILPATAISYSQSIILTVPL